MNQAFVTAVRATGGNNTDRVLILNGYNANIDYTVSNFVKPPDTSEDRLMLAVHYYDPYEFTLEENDNVTWWGLEESDYNYIEAQINKVFNFAFANSIPVFLGEYGVVDKNNNDFRTLYLNTINGYTIQYGFVTLIGITDTQDNMDLGFLIEPKML